MQAARRQVRLAASLCAAVALAACTGHDGAVDTHASTAGLPDDSAGLDPTRTGPAPDIDGAVRGGVVTIPVPDEGGFNTGPYPDVHTLDPSEVNGIPESSVLSDLVTRSLTQYVWDDDADGLVLVPDLATDLGTPNDDYTEWTFTIRDGVRFEDGTPVTADDVAYGIKRSMDKKTLPGAPTWGRVFFLHGHTYHGLYTSGSGYDGIVVDGNRLTIKMSQPFPDMPFFGAFPEMGPIPQAGSEPATYYLHPMATGPYKVKDYVVGTSLTLVRNEEWDPATDPGRHQYVDGFDFEFGADTGATLDALIADRGRAQTSVTIEGLSSNRLLPGGPAADRMIAGPLPCTGWMDIEKIDDVQVRRALGYAWPYRRLWRANGLIEGLTVFPAATIMPPAIPGWVAYDPLATQPGDTDPAAALRLLEDAGYGRGEFRIEFAYVRSDPTVTIITGALRRAGFDVVPIPEPTGDALDAIEMDPNSPLNITSGGYCPDWLNGASWVPVVFGGGVVGPDVDREIARVRALPLAQQAAAWGALDQTIETDDYPMIPTGHGGIANLRGSRIGGLHLDPVGLTPTLKDVYVIPPG